MQKNKQTYVGVLVRSIGDVVLHLPWTNGIRTGETEGQQTHCVLWFWSFIEGKWVKYRIPAFTLLTNLAQMKLASAQRQPIIFCVYEGFVCGVWASSHACACLLQCNCTFVFVSLCLPRLPVCLQLCRKAWGCLSLCSLFASLPSP